MVDTVADRPALGALLANSPTNWGRWGEDDEIGAINYLDPPAVIAAAQTIRSGKVFTLQLQMSGHAHGDPVWPGRTAATRFTVRDWSHYRRSVSPAQAEPGGLESADDYIITYLQGTTQIDALGHVWLEDTMWNGKSAETTVGALAFASVLPIAERAIVGRAILVDIARYQGVDRLPAGTTISLSDIQAALNDQRLEISNHDILLIRTGWLENCDHQRRAEIAVDFREPGLFYSPELVTWFAEHEIPALGTDTFGNEATIDPQHPEIRLALHAALMRNLGIVFAEGLSLGELAADCAADGQYEFLFVAAPLKIRGGSGAPVNPVVVK